jgi:hypothetical protein
VASRHFIDADRRLLVNENILSQNMCIESIHTVCSIRYASNDIFDDDAFDWRAMNHRILFVVYLLLHKLSFGSYFLLCTRSVYCFSSGRYRLNNKHLHCHHVKATFHVLLFVRSIFPTVISEHIEFCHEKYDETLVLIEYEC